MKVVFRVDSSIHIGSGHVMRCLVLASMLKEQGSQISFACRPQQGDLIDFVRSKGFEVKELVVPTEWSVPKSSADYVAWLQVPWKEDVKSFVSKCEHAELVIVDHYGINAEWEEYCKEQLVCKVFAIDDLLRSHKADIILDQTLLRDPSEYYVPGLDRLILTGCDFALLNRNFVQYRAHAIQSSPDKSKPLVLVSMGGIDQPNATLKVLNELASIVDNRPFVTVLLGPKAPNYQSVKAFCSVNSHWVRHIDFVDNMAELMTQHDIAIGAPGTTSWERACLGLPNIIIPLADNQKTVTEQLVNANAAIQVNLSDISNDLGSAYQRVLNEWPSFRVANLKLCDGLGVFRVVQSIHSLFDGKKNSILLRPATHANIRQVYDWQALPETRKYALNPEIPKWNSHQAWMRAKLAAANDYFYMIESLSARSNIGAIRLDKQTNGTYLISIFIQPECFGKGYAKQALANVDLLHPDMTIHATVLETNSASQRLFRSANYNQTSPDSFVRYPLIREEHE
ncbi:UDP-2,4-diacetamido-2,4,6-trideoxy-beta-L-altropyranose hydrolase [Vibrio superstes]|uniref:UDP-2,4-diacetamido-2,4,6-trideoxy-beta-L-altropyranose hydrolase n=1 Tax=Vibrio superstes NBRC 103154 TaxID=1219062 RepID=A0A511QU20_9VIBR|nr:UDP-2,4-diacetamido-2,4,6-trideoxy-beta-L-altropyranose hydrolase [Vibrio superstes]GEM80851.1 UDP-2,4-diacetamido-2,4,6-trideoxy-beta-L-altropyranose hydrolase [Vibrio superstes NBRC 103154]